MFFCAFKNATAEWVVGVLTAVHTTALRRHMAFDCVSEASRQETSHRIINSICLAKFTHLWRVYDNSFRRLQSTKKSKTELRNNKRAEESLLGQSSQFPGMNGRIRMCRNRTGILGSLRCTVGSPGSLLSILRLHCLPLGFALPPGLWQGHVERLQLLHPVGVSAGSRFDALLKAGKNGLECQ